MSKANAFDVEGPLQQRRLEVRAQGRFAMDGESSVAGQDAHQRDPRTILQTGTAASAAARMRGVFLLVTSLCTSKEK